VNYIRTTCTCFVNLWEGSNYM